MANSCNSKEFSDKLTIVDLIEEYGPSSFVGIETFAIVSDLSKEELESIYGSALDPYRPFVVITIEMYEAMEECHANDERERKRNANYHEAFTRSLDDLALDVEIDPAHIYESECNATAIIEKMKALPGSQGTRMYKKYVLGLTDRAIAKQEGVGIRSVQRCLKRGRKAMREVFAEYGVVS